MSCRSTVYILLKFTIYINIPPTKAFNENIIKDKKKISIQTLKPLRYAEIMKNKTNTS